MNQENIYDKDYIREQFGKALELLNTADHKPMFNEPSGGTPEQRAEAYRLNIFAEGYRAGAHSVKEITTDELEDAGMYLSKVENMLSVIYHTYFLKDNSAFDKDQYIFHYSDIQTLIDVAFDMTCMINKRVDEAYEELIKLTA